IMRRLSIEKLLASREELDKVKKLLAAGGLAAIPTETHYGFAVSPFDETAVERIFKIKGRGDGKPLPGVFGSPGRLRALLIEADAEVMDRFFQIWPAPLTVVLPIREPLAASRGAKTLGIRLPASAPLRELLRAVGPVTGTSVNSSGKPPLDDPDAVREAFAGEIDLLVDGGVTPGGPSSTILDATREPPVVLRAGAYLGPSSG